MAQSPTKRKHLKRLATELAEKEVTSEVIYTYLNWWTRKEINQLVDTGNLVLIPADGGYLVGRWTVCETETTGWEVRDMQDAHRGYFSSCQTAIFYSIFEQKQLYQRSARLRECDKEFYKLDNDVRYYRHKYKQAMQTGNGFKSDLWEARLSDSVPKMEHAREELQKLVISAKYMKVWENNHETARTRK